MLVLNVHNFVVRRATPCSVDSPPSLLAAVLAEFGVITAVHASNIVVASTLAWLGAMIRSRNCTVSDLQVLWPFLSRVKTYYQNIVRCILVIRSRTALQCRTCHGLLLILGCKRCLETFPFDCPIVSSLGIPFQAQRKIKSEAYYVEKKGAKQIKDKAEAEADLSAVAPVLDKFGF